MRVEMSLIVRDTHRPQNITIVLTIVNTDHIFARKDTF